VAYFVTPTNHLQVSEHISDVDGSMGVALWNFKGCSPGQCITYTAALVTSRVCRSGPVWDRLLDAQ
jgi:hypothetical protein